MNIFIMSRPSPGPARPAHTRPRPGPSPMCLNCFQPRPGPGPQYVGPGPARPAELCRGPRAAGRAGPGSDPKPGPRRALIYIQCTHTLTRVCACVRACVCIAVIALLFTNKSWALLKAHIRRVCARE